MTTGAAQQRKPVLADTDSGRPDRVHAALTRRALLQSGAAVQLLTLAPVLSACAHENRSGEQFSDGTYFTDGTGFI